MEYKVEKLHPSGVAAKVMSLQSLEEMTNNFSEEQKLGSGTFGKVYKGVQNGEEFAVKMFHIMQGLEDHQHFENEFENLGRLRHPNIVKLYGYCYEIKHEYIELSDGRTVFAQNIYRALCFEYLDNGSIKNHLNDEYSGHDWQTRYKIIKGICEGLKYLHEGLETPIYHLDLKPDNILLGNDMVPKLADFGLSRFVGDEQTRATRSSLGTIRYLPPEYIEKNFISKKLDIFSLGVVIIDIMTGHKGYHKSAKMSSQEFIGLVHHNWRNRLNMVPRCTSLEAQCHQVKRCIEIALECVNPDRKKRPKIGFLIQLLDETEQMVEKMAMCTPPKTRNGPWSHVDKEEEAAAVMDMTVPSPRFRRICIFCGSSQGKKKSYQDAAVKLGEELVSRNIDLVYGGGSVGLMGLISRAVYNGGRHVIGVIPKTLMPREITDETVGEVKAVADMHQRKAEMARQSDAFIALPGGFGTLEELLEVIAWAQLGIHDKPVGLLNVDGYYDPLLSFIDMAVNEGFISQTARCIVVSAPTPKKLLDKLEVTYLLTKRM